MSDKKPESVMIIADDFSGGIGVSPEPIVLTKEGRKRYKIKKSKKTT